ncbi:hypothetical protein Mpop_3844 [Methylorubrum populi BJ001]|jgi:hypothetical protein|uniref:Uncharacterized protein n=1 Tax=Methylorubrum populi (strain ATCC BAA-705 / NCIMB 13946 / BJ001) TaxID=441620 RepID=B1Z9K9_METPB|nr:hypothetical protein Mpop_3844 [Methylorubrum populi BJ001]
MVDGGRVVEFPTGRRFTHRSLGRPGGRSVARIAQNLSGRRSSCRKSVAPDVPLSIRLNELTGNDDETVGRLTGLAHDGVITPASSARLAMLHADECGSAQPRRRSNVDDAAAYDLTLVGDPFGRFAFRLRGRKAWVVFAPAAGVGLVAELCLRDQIHACLLIGCGAGRRSTVRLLTLADWHRRIAVIGSGSNRFGSRHVLLLGGLGLREPEWSRALLGIERAIRRGETPS